MSQLKCEICGGADLIKQDGVFACQTCGAKYSVEEAQCMLGILYAEGDGVPQDYATAFEWFQKSAEKDNEEAQFYLGMFYYNGDGVPQDYAKAAEWYQKVAEQGHVKAQFLLGGLYLCGEGVPEDFAQAAMWLKKAATQGDEDAQDLLNGFAKAGRCPHCGGKLKGLFSRKCIACGKAPGEKFDDDDDDDGEVVKIPIVELFDESGEKIVFELLDTIEFEGDKYTVLTPYYETAEEYDLESPADAFIMKEVFNNATNESMLETVEDQYILQSVYGVFKGKRAKEFEFRDN